MPEKKTSGKIKNVILILTDQQRKDSMGVYGNPVIQTPSFDRLAQRSVRFERTYTQSAYCSPARTSILTGVYPHTHGVWYNGIQFLTGIPTLGQILQEHGYRTGSVGKIHINPWFGAPHPAVGYEESIDYWEKHREMKDWYGPYCGFQKVLMTIGHVDYSTRAGHYAAFLEDSYPAGIGLLRRDNALQDSGLRFSWHNAIPEKYHYNTWITERSMEMIDSFGEEPFFMHISFPDPHHPFSACEPYASMYAPDDMPEPIATSVEELGRMPPYYLLQHHGKPNEYEKDKTYPSFPEEIEGKPLKEMMALTYGMVTHIDACIGRLLGHLEARGLLGETMIIFTTDHGELLGDHGQIFKGPFFYQSLLNVPLIIYAPGIQPAVCADFAAHVDLVPTVLDCLNLGVPEYLPGYSLRGCLFCREGTLRDGVLTEFRPFHCPNMKVLHFDHWKYVYYHEEPFGELFDLVNDPEERVNLHDDPGFDSIRMELRDRLFKEMVSTEVAWPPQQQWR